jgi:hypothetical protein
MAVPQRPCASLARNDPPAPQSPAELHDIEVTFTLPAALVPGSRVAVRQIPGGAAPAGIRVPAAA